jgi:hypothetical protein
VVGLRGARLTLLILVAVGVAFMHTLGHPSSSGGHAGGATHHAAVASHPLADSPAVVAFAGDDGAVGFDPMTVCLAVLLGGFVLLFAALVLMRSGTAASHDRARRAHSRNGRAPPPTTVGLRLADLSVLRT